MNQAWGLCPLEGQDSDQPVCGTWDRVQTPKKRPSQNPAQSSIRGKRQMVQGTKLPKLF